MRILVTNDDGVHAPGIAALLRELVRTLGSEGHDLVVAAPLDDHSGSGTSVGAILERETVGYRSVTIPGAEGVPTFGVDAPPALGVILACFGAFGPSPDVVVSGINHGINVGRSTLHSGTVGAALTGAHFGLRGLAVSIRSGTDPVPWETAAVPAARLVGALATAPVGTVLNLNVPDVPLAELRGIRHGRLRLVPSSLRAPGTTPVPEGDGEIPLAFGQSAANGLGTLAADPDPDLDASLVHDGWGALTPLAGVREDLAGVPVEDLAAFLEHLDGIGDGALATAEG